MRCCGGRACAFYALENPNCAETAMRITETAAQLRAAHGWNDRVVIVHFDSPTGTISTVVWRKAVSRRSP